MNMRQGFVSVALTCSMVSGLGVAAHASVEAQHAQTPEASIPFADHGGIYDWEADRQQGLWVQDIHRNWYYAKFMGPCIGLDFANVLAFDTRPLGTFDRFSKVRVPRERMVCTVQSFVRSSAPPVKQGRKPHAMKAATPADAAVATPDEAASETGEAGKTE